MNVKKVFPVSIRFGTEDLHVMKVELENVGKNDNFVEKIQKGGNEFADFFFDVASKSFLEKFLRRFYEKCSENPELKRKIKETMKRIMVADEL